MLYTIFFEAGSLLNLDTTRLGMLVCQQAPGILPSLPPQYCDYKGQPLYLTFWRLELSPSYLRDSHLMD